MPRQTYVIRGDKLVPKSEAQSSPGASQGAFFVPDIKPFITQDGVEISSRSSLRAYEQKHGVKQCGNDWTGSAKPKFWDQIMKEGR